jgi:hypothetical protein
LDVRSFITAPFLVMFAFGFFYVSLMTFQAERAKSSAPVKPEESGVAPEQIRD